MHYVVVNPLAAIIDSTPDAQQKGRELVIMTGCILKQVRSDAVYTYFKKTSEKSETVYRSAHEVFSACVKFSDQTEAANDADLGLLSQLTFLDACASNEEEPSAPEGQARVATGMEYSLADVTQKLHELNIKDNTEVYLRVHSDSSMCVCECHTNKVIVDLGYDEDHADPIWRSADSAEVRLQRGFAFIMDERFRDWFLGIYDQELTDIAADYTPYRKVGV